MAVNLSHLKNLSTWIKNSEMKYIVFGLIGGIYFSPNFKPWIKRCWLWLNLIFGSVICIMIIGYFVTADITDWKTAFNACCIAENVVVSAVISPLLTYYFRKELDLVLRLNSKENRKNVEDKRYLRTVKNHITYIIITSILLYAIIHLGFVTYPLIAANDDYLHDVKFYLVPNPFIQNINSPLQFISLALLMGLIILVPSVPSFLCQMNILVVAYEFSVAFSILCYRMAQFSRISETTFVQLNEEYLYVKLGTNSDVSFAKVIDAESQKLTQNMVDVIEAYQRLRK